jgi:flagellar motor switch protein FliN
MSEDVEDKAGPGEGETANPGAASQKVDDQMAAQDEEQEADASVAGKSVDLKDLSERQGAGSDDDESIERSGGDLEAVFDIPVNVSAVLGKSHLQVSQLLKLGRGAIVELDRKVGEAIDIYVNDRLVARGEVVLVEDRLGVTMTEIVKGEG